MKNCLNKFQDGYRQSISNGLKFVSSISGKISYGKGSESEMIEKLKDSINTADAIVVGAGSGLSTAAGFTYSGSRFRQYFFDFEEKYGIRDIYSGGFYPFPKKEIFWAWWARHIYFNRYVTPIKPVYSQLLSLISNKDYFVVTTNVDHLFQKSGFDKNRLFYTQGDYGLFQKEEPSDMKTYDNEEWTLKAIEASGFIRNKDNLFEVPTDRKLSMELPSDLIPLSPDDQRSLVMNLRSDDSFVEDYGWKNASNNYARFLNGHKKAKVLYLELGVGANTPVIIKYPFWYEVFSNHNSSYACINYGQSFCPIEIEDRSLCIDADITQLLNSSLRYQENIA